MKNRESVLTIAVTGVGAIIGQGIVRSIRATGRKIRVIGVDRNERSPGTYMVDAFEKKYGGEEETLAYRNYWTRIVRQHDIKLIMPGLDVDVLFFDQNRSWFDSLGVVLVLNSHQLIQKTCNKWLFGKELASIGYPAIPSIQPDTWGDALQALGPPPLLLKPLQGNGSRGIVEVKNKKDFDYWRGKYNHEWMLQRIVGKTDEEYTVGVFGIGEGQLVGPLIFRRHLSTSGNTQEAEVVRHHSVMESAIKQLCSHFCPVGPTNLQFRIEGEIAYLLEINARFSSSNSLRTAFGFNEAAMAIEFYYEGKIPEMPSIKEGVAWRYFEDFVIHAGHSV
jgi:carbamoyl-phosphate synthase large subunit